MDKLRICFVCSDNIGRSVTAEYCLRDYLEKHRITDFEIYAAGTNANSDITGFSLKHFDELKDYGIDASGFLRTQLTREIVATTDLLVAMAAIHQEWIKEQFDRDVPLYNEIYREDYSSVNYSQPHIPGSQSFDLTHYIYAATPVFAVNMRKWIQNFAESHPCMKR